jgi:carboxyl-terminal processing protease
MPIILAVVLVIGMFLGNVLRKDDINKKLLIYPQNKLSALIDFIEEEYVDTIDKTELIENAIPMILESLDPHSLYIPAKELQSVNEPLEGNFEGIGIQFNIQKDTVMVINTIPGGPSEKVGVMPGDRIVKVNDSLIAGVDITNSQIMKLLKGKLGTKVMISVSRKGFEELLNFKIIRDRIPLESVDVAYMINDELGYIKISKFALTTYNEFVEAIAELKSKGLKKLIVDLRGNGGGFMNAATNVANEFLSDDKIQLLQIHMVVVRILMSLY